MKLLFPRLMDNVQPSPGSIPGPRLNSVIMIGGYSMEKKNKVEIVETADQQLVKRVIKEGVAVCGHCGKRLVNFEGTVKCRFCWFCGKPVLWR